MPLLTIEVPQAFVDLCRDDDVDPVDVLRDLVDNLMDPMDLGNLAEQLGNKPEH